MLDDLAAHSSGRDHCSGWISRASAERPVQELRVVGMELLERRMHYGLLPEPSSPSAFLAALALGPSGTAAR